MPRHFDHSRHRSNARISDDRDDTATQGRLKSAVAELRRLRQGQLLEALERLVDIDDILDSWNISNETVPSLRLWTAEYLRIAAELETSAQDCRLIAQELRKRIAALVADGQQAEAPKSADGWAGRIHRITQATWLRMIPQREQSSQKPLDNKAVATSSANLPRRPGASSHSLPPQRIPDADVVAQMLGPLELHVAGKRVVRWSSLKARAVFQYLLIHHDRPVRRELLMNLQWPDHTHSSARNNLNVALHSLRNTLDGPWHELQPILYRDGCYALNPGLKWWRDRDEFLSALGRANLVRVSDDLHHAIGHYQIAVELYRGPLFEDDLSDDWYLPERRHLHDLYLEALEGLSEFHLELGDPSSAEYFGQLALTSDPCCEPVHRLMMRCYAAEHKQHLVTRQYRLCVDALREELGISPAAETLRLFRDLTSSRPVS